MTNGFYLDMFLISEVWKDSQFDMADTEHTNCRPRFHLKTKNTKFRSMWMSTGVLSSSLSDNTSYRNISQNDKLPVSFWNLTASSAAALSRHKPNFKSNVNL